MSEEGLRDDTWDEPMGYYEPDVEELEADDEEWIHIAPEGVAPVRQIGGRDAA